jgi:hypothetical protein
MPVVMFVVMPVVIFVVISVVCVPDGGHVVAGAREIAAAAP